MFNHLTGHLSGFWKSLKETTDTLRWVQREFYSPEAARFLRGGMAWGSAAKLFELSAPWLMGYGINALYAHDQGRAVLTIVSITSVAVVRYFCDWRGGLNHEPFVGEHFLAVDKRLNERFFEKELGLHVEENESLCASTFEKGRTAAEAVGLIFIFQVLDCVLTLVLTFLILAWLDLFAAGVVLMTIVVSLIISAGMNQFLSKHLEEPDREYRALRRYQHERWDSVERVVTAGKAEEEVRLMQKRLQTNLTEERAVWKRYVNFTLLRAGSNQTGYTAIALVCGYLVLADHMETPHLLSVLTWTYMVTAQIRFLARAEREVGKHVPSLKALRKALELPTKVKEAESPVTIAEDTPISISFERVSYGYRDGRGVLKDMSFTIDPGEWVALIGPSGAGKSTAVKLLQRYMDPAEGNVLVNGVNLRNLSMNSWRQAVAYIPQKPQIFDGTLRENLLYGLTPEEASRVTDQDLMAFMESFQINFGERLVNGVNTRVGKGGMQLSGGQAQRVMIGAAVLKKPRFMIIDEATSSCDAESQHEVQQALYELLEETRAGAVIIAHRLSTVRMCKKFVVLREAKGQESQPQVEAVAHSFQELYQVSPTFRRLADLEGISLTRNDAPNVLPTPS